MVEYSNIVDLANNAAIIRSVHIAFRVQSKQIRPAFPVKNHQKRLSFTNPYSEIVHRIRMTPVFSPE